MSNTNSIDQVVKVEENPLADLLIIACSRVWQNDGEILASGIGLIPRIAASVAMHKNPDLMMTDSEAFIVSEPVPVGKRNGYWPQYESWMGFSRVFHCLWSGTRHALVGPTQIDRYGQANISAIGNYQSPKVQMLGVRGFPGNSISHTNSFFVPSHNTRVFVEGEVDTVCSIGYNPHRMPNGYSNADIKIGNIITNLCVMDFNGTNNALRIVSLHEGVSLEQVQDNTSFSLEVSESLTITPKPTDEDRAILDILDPNNLRITAI